MAEQPKPKQLLGGKDLMLKLCEAMNINPRNVSEIIIVAKAGDVARVTVHRLIEEGELAQINWGDLKKDELENG